jgi:hypothetical protein
MADNDDDINAWTKAFRLLGTSDLTGKDKTNAFKKLYGLKKRMDLTKPMDPEDIKEEKDGGFITKGHGKVMHDRIKRTKKY